MKAIELTNFGGVENLQLTKKEKPTLNNGEVLVKVKNIGLNPVDYKTRQGGGIASRFELPGILGWDISGEIEVENDNNPKFKKGDAVFGMVNFPGVGNAYAEYVAVPENQLALKPSNLSFEEAAALTLAPLTAYQALVKEAKVKKGDRVLVQAAAGGVGHLAVQILKNVGAHVIGTASGKNEQFVKDLGVDEFIDYTKEDFTKLVSDVDVVFDGVGEKVGEESIKVLKQGGIMISIPSGVKPDWKALRPDVNAIQFLVVSNGEDMEALAKMTTEGNLTVTVSDVLPFEKVGEAHLQLETRKTQGKIVLSL
jgi:NADPH:quinone reductase-like Zn-dependent oxidoreductase